MGKKSRKKGQGGDKQSHKARVQERRERVEEQLLSANYSNDGDKEDYDGYYIDELTVLEGDVVWFDREKYEYYNDGYDNPDPNDYRGIVRKCSPPVYLVQPVSNLLRNDPSCVEIDSRKYYIRRDIKNKWTTRFDVGDRVVCSVGDSWVLGTVLCLWPIWERRGDDSDVPVYKIVGPGFQVAAPDDLDYCVQMHPEEFRFQVGDPIILNWRKALLGKPVPSQANDWEPGTVTKVDLVGIKHESYAVYQCTTQFSQEVYIVKDDDEHICASSTKPRERLLAAIDQDCSYQHIAFLVNNLDIDVLPIRDMLCKRATDQASFDAFHWLEVNMGLEMAKLKFEHGNGILHKIAGSPQALRFLRGFWRHSKVEGAEETSLTKYKAFGKASACFWDTNQSGQTWLEVLLESNNLKAIDFALSIQDGLFWEPLSNCLRWEDLSKLASITSGDAIKTLMVEQFRANRTLHDQTVSLRYLDGQRDEPSYLEKDFMATFRGENATGTAKRLIRFLRQWEDRSSCPVKLTAVLQNVIESGFSHIFTSMHKADPTILQEPLYRYTSRETQNEYVQQELCTKIDDRHHRTIDAVALATEGVVPYRPYLPDSKLWSIGVYLNYLRGFLERPSSERPVDFASLLANLKEKQNAEQSDSEQADILKHQIEYLEDEASLPGRIRILDFLVKECGMKPPVALEAVRMRQCGIIRWMVQNSLLRLNGKAINDNQINSPQGRKLSILGGQRIPNTASSGTLLAFACVEFDSLQTLAWLVEEEKIPVSGVIGGFNLLHACAYFGRTEILVWLCTRDGWGDLKSFVSTRSGFVKFPAVHVAVGRGHTKIADILLDVLGCPSVDGEGRTPDAIALASPNKHVREWGSSKALPLTLSKDIEKLVRHVSKKSYSAAKSHLQTTNCLSLDRWKEAGIYNSTDSLPSGKSYRSVVLQCLRGPDEVFILWLSHKLTSISVYDLQDMNRFWGKEGADFRYKFKKFAIGEVQEIATDDTELSQWLSYPWEDASVVLDPADSNPIIWSGVLNGEVALKFHKQSFTFSVCRGLLDAASNIDGQSVISKGMPTEVIKALATIYKGAAERAAKLLGVELEVYFSGYELFSSYEDQLINMESYLYRIEYDENHAIRGSLQHFDCSNHALSRLHVVLAIEGYGHLIAFCHRHGEGWTASMEKEVIGIGAYLSHDLVVSFFLRAEGGHFHASYHERCNAAMLGAAEAAKENEWSRLLELCGQSLDLGLRVFEDANKTGVQNENESFEVKYARRREEASSSLAARIVFGYLSAKTYPKASHAAYQAMMKKLVQTHAYSALSFLGAASLLFEAFHIVPAPEVFASFLDFLDMSLNLQPNRTDAKSFVEKISDSLFLSCYKEGGQDLLIKWATVLEQWGVDIQDLDGSNSRGFGRADQALVAISSLQAKQRATWAKLGIIKRGSPLVDVKTAIETGTLSVKTTDVGGLYLSHLSAAYNRVDVLEWLVETNQVSLNQLDHQDRTVLDVAQGSKADAAMAWIQKRNAETKISAFLGKYFRKSLALRRKKRLISGATRLQAIQRGRMTRKRFRGLLLMRVEESKRYTTIWAGVNCALTSTDPEIPSWSSLRNLNATRLAEVDHLHDLLETNDLLDAAASKAATFEDEESDDDTSQEANATEPQSTGNTQSTSSFACTKRTNIQLSSDTIKWLRQADGKYREFFVRRIQQLSAGDRSRILEKRLKGSTSTIYETYLEQKSGHRILWQYESTDSILIWYVAKHKNVSRLIRLIDDSQSRSARQRIAASSLPELAGGSAHEIEQESHHVLLNPRGNVPLKVYKIDSSELEQIIDQEWSPQLYLTEEERSIVEEKGTVLLLGRSGTGKTVCICNRMGLDRQRNLHHNSFTQLFVARSQRLSNYVKETAGEYKGCTFCTFGRLVESMESELPKLDSVRDLFLPSRKMDYARFKRDVHGGARENVDPMIAWTNIRTFLKGSIEALLEPDQAMSKKAFLTLGKKRCRLAAAEREAVYAVFARYQTVMAGLSLWDSCDRIASLLKRMNAAREAEHPSFETLRRTKIYVDEVQDYTQGEILLFFQLSGPGQLFLAGDPAQSVVEGVEFRFEEIRSVGYHVAGPDRRDLIPQKPKTVTVNFRSHSGVLDTAAAVLQRMFDAFPDSAKQLAKDRGLFTGPRPGVFSHVHPERLKQLVSEKLNGVVLLTHDSSVSYWKQKLGGYQLVYGIRAAKGLEFKRVIVLDFFAELPREIQKPWRDLLLGRDVNKLELEGQLKLLYTAVTRCIEQLFFAETVRSIAGDAFVRWLTTTSVRPTALATRQSVDDIESMAMTQDEWIASGLENAELAESSDERDLDESISLLEKALFCFEQGKEATLAQKARTHRMALLFQRDLQGENSMGDARVELRSAEILEHLLSENLLLEARRLMELSVLPRLGAYSRKKLENSVLSRIGPQQGF